MGLSSDLGERINSGFDDDHGPWRQYVLDHLDYINRRTVPYEIDKLLMNQYRFDLDRFLKDKLDRRNNIRWIVLLLNNMSCDMDFVEPGVYIIPTDDVIEKLYHSYLTIARNSF